MDQHSITSDQPANANYQAILDQDILELMGASGLPEDKKQALYAKMLDTIQNRVIARIADLLEEADLDEWQKLAESGDNAQVEQFLLARNIDTNQMMMQETLLYKTEMVELARPIRQVAIPPK